MFYGSVIFRFFGVLLRWIVQNSKSVFFNREKRVKFKEFWSSNLNIDFYSKSSNEFLDIIIGAFFILAVCALLFFMKV